MRGEWERQRLCLDAYGPWDVDATRDEHLRAAETCDRCPVKAKCLDDVYDRAAAGAPPTGLLAGWMWDSAQGPQTVDHWHSTHKNTGERRGEPKRNRARKYPLDWSEERVCGAVDCNNSFTVTPKTHGKLVCSAKCKNKQKTYTPNTYQPRVA